MHKFIFKENYRESVKMYLELLYKSTRQLLAQILHHCRSGVVPRQHFPNADFHKAAALIILKLCLIKVCSKETVTEASSTITGIFC